MRDYVVMTRLGKIIGLKDNIYSIQLFSKISRFFNQPIDNRRVGVLQACSLSETVECTHKDIAYKHFCMPYNNNFILVCS